MLWHFGCDLLKTVESACLCYIRIQSMLVVETAVKTFDYKLKNEMKWDEMKERPVLQRFPHNYPQQLLFIFIKCIIPHL